MQVQNYHYLFKFIVIGDTGVGKSCIVLQFIQHKIRTSHQVTIGVEFGAKTIPINNYNIKLQIWDTAGQENFHSITRSYYRSAIGALLVYDISRRSTFTNLKKWLDEVKSNGNPHLEILLVGNKNDLEEERAVTYTEGLELAKEHELDFIQINSREYEWVETAFKKVCENILQKIQSKSVPVGQGQGIKMGEKRETPLLDCSSIKRRDECC